MSILDHSRAAALCAACLAAVAATAGAQPLHTPSSTRAFSAADLGIFTVAHPCGSTQPVPGPGTIDLGCAGFGGSYQAFARAEGGEVHALASVIASGANPPNTQVVLWSATAEATWGDRLVTRGPARTALMTVAFDGALGADIAAGGGASASTEVFGHYGFGAIPAGSNPFVSFPVGAQKPFDLLAQTGGATSRSVDIDDVETFALDLGQSASWDFALIASGAAVVRLLDLPGGSFFSGRGVMNLSDTGKITALRFVDAAGVDVTDQEQFEFENGTQIFPATTAPEPAPWSLVVAGLAPLGAVARRRRGGPGR